MHTYAHTYIQYLFIHTYTHPQHMHSNTHSNTNLHTHKRLSNCNGILKKRKPTNAEKNQKKDIISSNQFESVLIIIYC